MHRIGLGLHPPNIHAAGDQIWLAEAARGVPVEVPLVTSIMGKKIDIYGRTNRR